MTKTFQRYLSNSTTYKVWNIFNKKLLWVYYIVQLRVVFSQKKITKIKTPLSSIFLIFKTIKTFLMVISCVNLLFIPMRESSIQNPWKAKNQNKTQIIFPGQKKKIFFQIVPVDIAQAVVALKLHHRSPSRRFVYFRRALFRTL